MMHNVRDILGFSEEEIAVAFKRNQLLSMEVEFASICNLRCSYCYSGKHLLRENELGKEELLDAISQARALGARKIIYLGAGEPLLDIKLRDVIHYVHKLGLEHVLFTNATLINKEMAHFLFEHEVVVIVKYPSKNEEVFDLLADCKGAFTSMIRGWKHLYEAGYPDKRHSLGIESVICTHNIKEIPDIWRWARSNNIIPYVECITRKGSALDWANLIPDKESIRNLFESLMQIDRDEFGIIWRACPPIAGFFCKRHLYSCTLNSQGFIQPCVGIDIKVGNIRTEKLASIIQKSKILNDLKNIRTTIKGTCKTCEYHDDCYGCRGNAYNLTGDYLASDPTCWRINNEASACSSGCKK
jgi:radical SAM protein with 4Fe4S-binding SPASM domain